MKSRARKWNEIEAQTEVKYLKSFDLKNPPRELGAAALSYIRMQVNQLEHSGFDNLATEVRAHHQI